jgi:HSP20 family protein
MSQRKPTRPTEADLGVGGILKGLGDLVSRLSELAESAEHERSGAFSIDGLGDKVQGVYGFSIRSAAGGAPRVAPFGNVRATAGRTEVVDVREPLMDLFDEGAELVIVVELPGVAEDEIALAVADGALQISTSGLRRYARSLHLPEGPWADQISKSYRNGMLEIRIPRRAS